MPHLVLVRHSIPILEENVPPNQWRLSEAGKAAALALAQKLASYSLDIIITSVERKAQETAVILAEELGVVWQTAPDLHEHERAAGPLGTREEFTAAVEALFSHPDELVMGLETAHQTLARYAAGVENVLAAHPDQTVAIVSHGTVMALYIAQQTGCDGLQLWQSLGLPTAIVLDRQAARIIKIIANE